MSRIVIIGSGVVGSATGKGFARHGHQVRFVDVDRRRVEALHAEGYEAGDQPSLGDEPSFVFLTLPTPNDGNRYDLSAFTQGVRSVGKALRRTRGFHTVVVRSTVPPGTCEGLVQAELEMVSGRKTGEGFGLASNPEFLRAACAFEDFLNPRLTVVGSRSRRTVERLADLYEPFGGTVSTFDNPGMPELIKCASNLFNAAKISFWNEMWLVARLLDLDADAVAAHVAQAAEGSFNPRYGIRGGSPYGGVCLPKDTRGFLGFAQQLGIDMPMLSAVVETNTAMEMLMHASSFDGRRHA